MINPNDKDYRKMLYDPEEQMILGQVVPIPGKRTDQWHRFFSSRKNTGNNTAPDNYRKRTIRANDKD